MIIVMKPGATPEQIEHVCKHIEVLKYAPHPIYGTERVVIGAIGDEHGKQQALASLSVQPGVESVTPILRPYKRVSKQLKKARTLVKVGRVDPETGAAPAEIGGDQFVVMAGPCSVEDETQLVGAARAVKEAGARILRGGAFKPRTSPYSFQGLEEEGLKLLAMAREETGLPFVTEVITIRGVELVAEYADMLQVGARNMMNYALLKVIGQCGKPVLLKRGLCATIEEMLMAAEYVASEGNENIVLCERGIRTFETHTRNTLDLSAVPAVHSLSHLPIIVDPSHGTGRTELVGPMLCAAVGAGADGAMVEVHPTPETAVSDGAQSLVPEEFDEVMEQVARYLSVTGRTL